MRKYTTLQWLLLTVLALSAPLAGSEADAADPITPSPTNVPAAAGVTQPYEPLTASLIGNAVADQEARIARLEAELADIRRSSVMHAPATPEAVFDSPPCTTCNRLYGTFEVTLLRPRVSGATPAFGFANGGRVIENSETLDRRGKQLTIKYAGPVEPYFKDE